MKKVYVKHVEPVEDNTPVDFWEQFQVLTKPNYSKWETIFHLEIKEKNRVNRGVN